MPDLQIGGSELRIRPSHRFDHTAVAVLYYLLKIVLFIDLLFLHNHFNTSILKEPFTLVSEMENQVHSL